MIACADVGEVAELRLPAHEGVAVGDRVAVLEAERGELRQHRVVDHELRLGVVDVRERCVLGFGVEVDERRVTLAERAATRSWPATRTGVPSSTSEPKASASAVAQSTWSLSNPVAPGREDAGKLRVHCEAVGEGGERGDDAVEAVVRHAGVDGRRRGASRARSSHSLRCGEVSCVSSKACSSFAR